MTPENIRRHAAVLVANAGLAEVEASAEAAEAIPYLVAWGLAAGADYLDLLSTACPATVLEVVREAALLHGPAHAAASPAARGPVKVAPDPAPRVEADASPITPAPVEPRPAGLDLDAKVSCPSFHGARPLGTGGLLSTACPRAEADASPIAPAPVEPRPAGLDAFAQELRDYQRWVVDHALAFAERVLLDMDVTAPEADRRWLYAFPTGTGKGTAQLALLRELRALDCDAWILTPSLEVLRGYLERTGHGDLSTAGEEKLAELGERIYVTTPTRARNRILEGKRSVPEAIIYDEVHHATEGNDVSGTLFALAPLACWLGFTATPFRATARATAELEKAWPNRTNVLTIPQAVERGAWSLPTFEVVPLCDDDVVKVAGGDFQTKAAGKLVSSRVEAIARLVAERLANDSLRCGAPGRPTPSGWLCANGHGGAEVCSPEPRWIPTAVTVPSTESAGQLVEALDRLGIPARRVGQDTGARERALAYQECREGKGVLVSVRVLSEGVDLPWLRRLIDARPTVSPVSWLQQIGRITRPGPIRPEYICVCRNLERHAYLLSGLVPRRAIGEAQQAFGGPSKRSTLRTSAAFEQLSRFKAIDLPLRDGVRGQMFALYSTDRETGRVTEWVTLLDPTSERQVSATREVVSAPDGSRSYGRWVRAPLPDELVGFATSQLRGKVSDKQKAWWKRSAAAYGLDPSAADELTQRQFAALPVLADLRLDLHAQEVAA